MTKDDESFFQEVDEGLRHDQTLAVIKRYGPAAAIAFVLALAGLWGWTQYQQSQINTARASADRFIAAQEKARNHDLAGAVADFQTLTTSGPQTYRVLAMMERAAMLEAQGDLDGALAGFDAAAEAAKDPLLRDTARIRAAYIVADRQDLAAVRARIDPLIAEGGRISYLARELLGVKAWEAGDLALARDTMQNLNLAFDAPESVRQRTSVALAVLGPAPAEQGAAATPAPAQTGDAQ